jgi:hypothetical protein
MVRVLNSKNNGAEIQTNPNKNCKPIKKNRKLQKTEYF